LNIIDSDPKDDDIYWQIARIHAEQKNYALAEADCNKGIHANPKSPHLTEDADNFSPSAEIAIVH
jgi:hypothetical protein